MVNWWVLGHIFHGCKAVSRSQITPGAAKRERKECVCVCVCICFVYWTDKWVVEHMLSSVLQQRKKSLL